MSDTTKTLFIDAIVGAGFENCDIEDVTRVGLATVTEDGTGQQWASWDLQKLAGQPLEVLIAIYNKQRPDAVDALRGMAPADPQAQAQDVDAASQEEVLELAEAMETRRILEEIKAVAKLHPLDDMPTPYQSAWRACCEEIFYRATGCRWHMEDDARRFARAANDKAA